MKKCAVCLIEKPLESFHANSRNRDGRHSYCKSCAVLKLREWREKNIEHAREKERQRDRAAYARDWRERNKGNRPEHAAQRIARTYGLSVDEYWKRLEDQGRCCAICRQPEDYQQAGRTKRLSVDHDHETGAVRGFLCGRCNSGLGYFRDDPDMLRAAAAYLEEWRERAAEGDPLAA